MAEAAEDGYGEDGPDESWRGTLAEYHVASGGADYVEDVEDEGCPETSNGQHTSTWHAGGKCAACGQDGPQDDEEGQP